MLLDTYQQAAFDLLYKARTTQREAIIKVGTLMADAIEREAAYISTASATPSSRTFSTAAEAPRSTSTMKAARPN